MWYIKIIKGDYSYQNFGEKVFIKFNNYEDAKYLYDELGKFHLKQTSIIFAPVNYFKSWSEIQKISCMAC